MALEVETGTGKSNADSYITMAELIAYAANRGTTIVDEAASEQSYIRPAFDFINALEERLMGFRNTEDQIGAYPRVGVYLRGYERSSSEIPVAVKELQMSLGLELALGTDIWNRPLSASNPVKRNRVEGVVEQEFAVLNGQAKISQSRSLALISELMGPGGTIGSVALSRG